MKTEKLFYETPEALIVPLRPRRVMCQSLDYGAAGCAGGDIEDGNEYDL